MLTTLEELSDALSDDFNAVCAIENFKNARNNMHEVAADCRLIDVISESTDDILESLMTADIIKSYMQIEIINRVKALREFDNAQSSLVSLVAHYKDIIDL